MNYLIVFLGGGAGSVLRFLLSQLLPGVKEGFPYATLAANVLACLLLGVSITLFSRELLQEQQRLFLLTGVCGGFSTFSTFGAETLDLYAKGESLQALAYVTISLAAGIAALAIGMKLG